MEPRGLYSVPQLSPSAQDEIVSMRSLWEVSPQFDVIVLSVETSFGKPSDPVGYASESWETRSDACTWSSFC